MYLISKLQSSFQRVSMLVLFNCKVRVALFFFLLLVYPRLLYIRVFSCHICIANLTKVYLFQIHVSRQAGNAGRCTQCQKTKKKRYLNVNKREEHTENVVAICNKIQRRRDVSRFSGIIHSNRSYQMKG